MDNAKLVRLLAGYENLPVIFSMRNDMGWWEYYEVTGVIKTRMADTPLLQMEWRSVDPSEILGAGGKGHPEGGG